MLTAADSRVELLLQSIWSHHMPRGPGHHRVRETSGTTSYRSI
jgi:hypothetical protein